MKRVNDFNDDYFEKIDTEEKAYFLGLLFADGNVYEPRHRVQITLINEDDYILQKLSSCINYKGKMYIDKKKYTKLILNSLKMCQDLIKLGCIPKKSLTLQFPTNVPKELLHHFIRGYFDGDGHVSKRSNCFNVNFTSSENFINKFIDILNNLNIEHTGIKKRYKNKEKSACQVYIKASSARLFFDYIYKDSTIYLTRKKKIVDQPNMLKLFKKCKMCENKSYAKELCKKHYRNNYFQINKK